MIVQEADAPIVTKGGVSEGTPVPSYKEHGNGPVLLFLHGLGGNRHSFDHQLDALSGRYRCVAWDVPRYGGSAPMAAMTFPALAARDWPHMFLTLCPTYMGIARAAFSFTCQYLRGEVAGGPPAGASLASPVKQLAVANMRIRLEQTEALFQRAIREAKHQPSKAERLRAYAAQYTVMENANALCVEAIRVCGGSAIFKNLRLEQLYRDSRCGSLMLPWTPDICVERLGAASLEAPLE